MTCARASLFIHTIILPLNFIITNGVLALSEIKDGRRAMSAIQRFESPHYTYEDFCQWEGQWELIQGIPYAMTPDIKAAECDTEAIFFDKASSAFTIDFLNVFKRFRT